MILSPSMRPAVVLSLLCGALPAAAQTHPFPGVTMVRDGGGTMIVADLCAAGVSVRSTRYGERHATPGAWGSRGDVGAAAAVNGDFYDFPSAASVSGRARGAGEDWPPGTQQVNPEVRSYWQFGSHAAALVEPSTIAPPGAPTITEIVGAHNVIIRGGRSLGPDFDGDGVLASGHARTAIGLSADGRYLYLFATRTSMTGAALANAVLSYAARAGSPQVDVATNEDGGGSSQMYVRGLGQVVDSGRPVANHLGVRAGGTGDAPQCPRVDCPEGQTNAPGDPRRCVPLTDYRTFLADFDADGRSDLATISANGGGAWAGAIAMERSTGTGFASSTWAAHTPTHMRNGGSTLRYRVVLGDFDGDARADLLTVSPNGGGGWAEWASVELSTGRAFTSATWNTPTPTHMRNGNGAADYRVLVGDFNGDGLSDLVTMSPNGGGGWAAWAAVDLSTGAGFTSTVWNTPTPMHMRNGGAADYRVMIGDFNGDGRSDVATISPDGGGGWADWVSMDLSTGTGFAHAVWAAATPTHMRNGDGHADYRVLVGDFNGDGRSDLATISPTGGGGWAEWAAMELSTGTGFASTVWRTPTPMHMRNGDGHADYRVLVGDFNGDGRSDLATVSPTGGGGWADWVAMDLSTGRGFAETVWSAATPGHMRRGGGADYRVLVGDLDADGRSDLVTVTPNGGGGWAEWAAVELDTGSGFASAAWSARTPLLMRLGAATPLAPRSDEASGYHRPRRPQPPEMDAGVTMDGAVADRPTPRADAVADIGSDVGSDVGSEETDAGDDGPEGRMLTASCGCRAAGASGGDGRAGWALVLIAYAATSRGRAGRTVDRPRRAALRRRRRGTPPSDLSVVER